MTEHPGGGSGRFWEFAQHILPPRGVCKCSPRGSRRSRVFGGGERSTGGAPVGLGLIPRALRVAAAGYTWNEGRPVVGSHTADGQMDDCVTHTCTRTPSQECKGHCVLSIFSVLPSLIGTGLSSLIAGTLFPDVSTPGTFPGTPWALNKYSVVQVVPPSSKFLDSKIFRVRGQ